MYDKEKAMVVSFDIKFIRLKQKNVRLVQQAPPFLHCFWSCSIYLISKDTNMVFFISVLQIKGNKDNSGIISHISPSEHILRPIIRTIGRDGSYKGSQHILLRNKKNYL